VVTAAVALVVATLALAIGSWYLRAEQQKLRERELSNDLWAAALGRREADVRRREKAVWWAERTPRWSRITGSGSQT
jgi:hypothetical protein